MNQHTAADIIERLERLESHLCKLDKIVNMLTRNNRLSKELKEIIMANHEAELAAIADIKTEVISVGQQIVASLGTLRDKITALEAQVAAGGDTSDILAALADLKTNVQATDDLVDDLPVTIPPVE